MTTTNTAELRKVYLHTFDAFATSPHDVMDSVEGVGNVRFARELLGTLTQAGLVAESEDGDGEACWQTFPDTYDTMSREEAESLIDNWLDSINSENQKDSTMSTKTETKTKPAKASEGFHACYCGCGENVPAKSFYRPGHDARHAGVIGRRVAETADDSHFNDLPSERLVLKAKGIAIKAIEKAQAKAEREAAKNAPEVTEGTITVGKNERVARRFKDGKVEYLDPKSEDWKAASKTAAETFTA